MKLLALEVPGYGEIKAPDSVPTGGAGMVGSIIGVSFGLLIFFAILLSLLFMIYGGYSWITSGGDKTKLDKARKTILYSIIGLLFTILSMVMISFIGQLLGVKYF